MKIQRVISFINSLKNAGQGRYLKTSDIISSFNNASTDLLNKLTPLYQADQNATDMLRSFQAPVSSNPIVNGQSALASDYQYGTSFWCFKAGKKYRIDMLRDSEFIDRENSKLLPPTTEYPIGKIRGNAIQVLPVDYDAVLVEYLRKPADVNIVYSMSEDGRTEIPNIAASTDTDWTDRAIPELIKMMATTLGITLRDGWLTQYKQQQQ